jgi:hypothetical protein
MGDDQLPSWRDTPAKRSIVWTMIDMAADWSAVYPPYP